MLLAFLGAGFAGLDAQFELGAQHFDILRGTTHGKAGGGGADYYELKDGGYVFKERFNYWVS